MPACPLRFRRPTLLVVGCGDVGMRALPQLVGRWRVLALTSDAGRVEALRAAGARPIVADLDRPGTLGRLAGLADAVLHLAPPQGTGAGDARTANLVRALARVAAPRRWVYVSTSGVYGDCAGARVDETRTTAPATDRARRRVDAERRLRRHARQAGARLTVLRAPGIYALGRAGGDPRERLAAGTPVLAAADDVHTNRIHADDLARACVLALHRGPSPRVLNVSDDSDLRMGDWLDLAADRLGLPRPPRISRAEAAQRLTPMQMSFLSESRRLVNTRMKQELRMTLRYPTGEAGLASAAAATTPPR